MQGQTIETKVTVDATQATAEIAKFNGSLSSLEGFATKSIGSLEGIQKGAKSLQEKLGPVAAAISGVSSALGQTGGEAAKVVAGVGQMAAAFGAGGPWAVALVGGTMLLDEYTKAQKENEENQKIWRSALQATSKVMRESTLKSTEDLVQALKDAQTEIRNFGKTAQEAQIDQGKAAIAAAEKTLSIVEKSIPRFQEIVKSNPRTARYYTDAEEKESIDAIEALLSNALERRNELTQKIQGDKKTLDDLIAANKTLKEIKKEKPTAQKKAEKEIPILEDYKIDNMFSALSRKISEAQISINDSFGKAAQKREDMLQDIARRGADVRIGIAEQEAQSISGIVIGSLGGLDQIAMGATSTVASGLQQMTTDMLTGQEHIAERFGALVMQQAGQSLVSSGTKLAGEAVVSAFTPGAQPIAAAQAGAAAGLIAAGVGLGGAATGLENIAGGGSFNKPKDKSGERDKGVAPRSSRERGGGGPLVINVSYGVGGPLPEDTAREIAKVQRQGARRGGA